MKPKLHHSNRTVINLAALILLASFSFFIVAPWSTNVNTHQHATQQIDEKIQTVLELTAASTATSAIISLLPDDQATPIADQLADFSSYFLIALCALYLEKYLVSLVGYASFSVLFPFACGLGIISIWRKSNTAKNVAVKLGAFALIIYLIIPASITISDTIYATYEDSIQATIDTAEETANMSAEESEESGDSQSIVDQVVDIVKETASTITGFATDILSNFIEALAVMLVTSCIIPVVVLMAAVWIAKLLFSIPLSNQTILDLPDDVMNRLHP